MDYPHYLITYQHFILLETTILKWKDLALRTYITHQFLEIFPIR